MKYRAPYTCNNAFFCLLPCQLQFALFVLLPFSPFQILPHPLFPSLPRGPPPLFADVSVRLEEAKTHRPQMFRALVHNCPLTARSGLCATMEEIHPSSSPTNSKNPTKPTFIGFFAHSSSCKLFFSCNALNLFVCREINAKF